VRRASSSVTSAETICIRIADVEEIADPAFE